MTKERYHNIDLLEFFAILCVIVYHSCYVNMSYGSSMVGFLNYIFRPFIATCVPIFFFANGFLIIDKKFDLKKHLKKTGRLTALTLVWGAINLIALMPLKGEYLTPGKMLLYLEKWEPGWINHFWFMGALICIYLFYPLIKNAFDNNRKIFNFIVILCVVLVFGNLFLDMLSTVKHFLAGDSVGLVKKNYFNMFNPLRGVSYVYTIPYFLIGCFFGGNKAEIKERVEKSFLRHDIIKIVLLLMSITGLGFWSIFVSKIGADWDIVWNGYNTVFTLVSVILMYLLSEKYKYNRKNPVCKLVQLISCNTLGIYFMHKIVCTAFENIGLVHMPFMQNYLSNFIYALVVALICLAVSLILKKIPILKKLVA